MGPEFPDTTIPIATGKVTLGRNIFWDATELNIAPHLRFGPYNNSQMEDDMSGFGN
jgi:hypothetical protein